LAWLEKIGSEEMSYAMNTNSQLLKCLPRCERQSESWTFSFSTFPVEGTFSQHQDFCLALKKVSRICSNPTKAKLFEAAPDQTGMTCNELLSSSNTLCNEYGKPNLLLIQSNPKISNFIYKYAKSNLAVLRVFIKDPYYTLIKTDEQMNLISFLGNAGGLLSLCLGLSLVSIFEIVYHIINYLTIKMQRKQFLGSARKF
jgi:hypothetical protein